MESDNSTSDTSQATAAGSAHEYTRASEIPLDVANVSHNDSSSRRDELSDNVERKLADEEEEEEEDEDYDPETALLVPEPAILHPIDDQKFFKKQENTLNSSSYTDKAKDLKADRFTAQQDIRHEDSHTMPTNEERHAEIEQADPETNPSQSPLVAAAELQAHSEELLTQAGSSPQSKQVSEPESDDDYDPERDIVSLPSTNQKQEPKSATESSQAVESTPRHEVSGLKEAYEAVMQSDVVRLERFARLSKEEQMEVIQQLLQEKQIPLPGIGNASANSGRAVVNEPVNKESPAFYSDRPDISQPMTDEENEAYEKFLDAEAQFLGSGEELPESSRLFVGNLPTNTVKKQDLFRLFRRYGELVEISIKTGYGFAQFRTVEACQACKQGESGRPIYDRFLRLDSSHRRKNNLGDLDQHNGRGRERPSEAGFEVSDTKRFKPETEDVKVLVTSHAGPTYISEVENLLQSNDLTYSRTDIGEADTNEVIREAAYLGVLGVCVIKDSKIDLQVFEQTGDGGVKFDEYLDLTSSGACELLDTAKHNKSQMGTMGPARREDRGNKWKRNKTESQSYDFLDGRRRGFPDKPPANFNFNERGRSSGRANLDWQRNDKLYDNSANRRHGFNQGPLPTYGNPMFNQSPGFSNGPFGASQPFNPQQGYNNEAHRAGPYQNGRYDGSSRPPFGPQSQVGFHGGYNALQPTQNPMPGSADPALMQTLQNLDPNTMRSVVALLQQQGGANSPAPAPGAGAPQGFPSYQNSTQIAHHPHGSPSAQVNSLLSQLQSQPAQVYSAPNSYQIPPQQAYNNASQHQAQPNKDLMDMLSRLEGN